MQELQMQSDLFLDHLQKLPELFWLQSELQIRFQTTP